MYNSFQLWLEWTKSIFCILNDLVKSEKINLFNNQRTNEVSRIFDGHYFVYFLKTKNLRFISDSIFATARCCWCVRISYRIWFIFNWLLTSKNDLENHWIANFCSLFGNFNIFSYRISSYSFRGNYSLLTLALCTVTFDIST